MGLCLHPFVPSSLRCFIDPPGVHGAALDCDRSILVAPSCILSLRVNAHTMATLRNRTRCCTPSVINYTSTVDSIKRLKQFTNPILHWRLRHHEGHGSWVMGQGPGARGQGSGIISHCSLLVADCSSLMAHFRSGLGHRGLPNPASGRSRAVDSLLLSVLVASLQLSRPAHSVKGPRSGQMGERSVRSCLDQDRRGIAPHHECRATMIRGQPGLTRSARAPGSG